MEDRIKSSFEASMDANRRTLGTALPAIARAASLLAVRLRQGNQVLVCGNGGSAADAQHFAAELTGRFERERPGLPAVALTTDSSALTAIANDYGYAQVFARQVHALGRPGDVLLAISTSGESPSILEAVAAAHSRQLAVIALTGRDGGKIPALLRPDDVELRVASAVTARIQETHILILHCLCDVVDELLYPAGDLGSP